MRLFARSAAPTLYRAFLRGRLRGAGILPEAEAKVYAAPDLPVPMLVAFVMGALSEAEAALPSEAEVERAVKDRLAPAPQPEPLAMPAAASAASVPAAVADEPTQRVQPARWIGDPLPSSSRA